MNKTYIVDTNIILRLLLQDNPLQYRQAKELFADAKNGKINLIIPQVVIFEISFTLKKFYSLEKEDIIGKLRSLLSASYIYIESKEMFLVALRFYSNHNVSFVDCFLISQAKHHEAELLTFDKKLQKLRGEV